MRASGPVNARSRGNARLQQLALEPPDGVVNDGASFLVDADAPAIAIAGEHDEAARMRRLVHACAMIARTVPRQRERHESGMQCRRLEARAEVATHASQLVAEHRLRRADPGMRGL